MLPWFLLPDPTVTVSCPGVGEPVCASEPGCLGPILLLQMIVLALGGHIYFFFMVCHMKKDKRGTWPWRKWGHLLTADPQILPCCSSLGIETNVQTTDDWEMMNPTGPLSSLRKSLIQFLCSKSDDAHVKITNVERWGYPGNLVLVWIFKNYLFLCIEVYSTCSRVHPSLMYSSGLERHPWTRPSDQNIDHFQHPQDSHLSPT